MKTNEATWQQYHFNVSDDEWNQSGPVTRTVDLFSHASSIQTQSMSYDELANQGDVSQKVVLMSQSLDVRRRSSLISNRKMSNDIGVTDRWAVTGNVIIGLA